MQWNDFLAKIKTLKKDYETGQIDLRAGPLVTLLYAGAFDSVLGSTNLEYSDYRRLAKEMLDALNSKAAMPRAKKGDLLGIDGIASNLDLHIWRSETNPTYRFDFTGLFDSFLTSLQFTKLRDGDVTYRRQVEKKPEVLVFKSLKTLFTDEKYKGYLERKSRVLVGVVGIVKDLRIRKTKAGREMGSFRLFSGDGLSETIYIWPEWVEDEKTGLRRQEDFLPHQKTQHLKNGRSGIVLVRPGFWNNNPQLTMIAWLPTNERVGE